MNRYRTPAHERSWHPEIDFTTPAQVGPVVAEVVDEVFGPVVYAYSRAQAIEDGVLVDVSRANEGTAQKCPFKYPVAMTGAAYEETIAAGGTWEDDGTGHEVLKLPGGQSHAGRMHDVFWMLQLAIRTSRTHKRYSDREEFEVRVDTKGNGRCKVVKMCSVIGPGDTADPVITIMLQGED